MNVLIACEESQEVCKAFRERGHRAFSCDIQEPSGGHPKWHILGDCLPLINGRCKFRTMDGECHEQRDRWDLLIAHPPCTYLTVSANAYYDLQKYKDKAKRRYSKRYKAIVFFMQLALADCKKIAVENPVGIMSTAYRKPDQIIQPYQFGHPYTKQTCLWLKGLPMLAPTEILQKPDEGWLNQHFTKDGRYVGYGGKWGCIQDGRWRRYGDPEVAKERSKTFSGIARAMAEQWG